MSAPAISRRASLTVELAPDRTAPRRARVALERIAAELGDGARERLRLLVSELVTNSVLHAGLGPGDRIEVAVAVGDDAIRVAVSDPGEGFAAPRVPALDDEGGRGLYLVATLAERWGCERGDRMTVWFELRR